MNPDQRRRLVQISERLSRRLPPSDVDAEALRNLVNELLRAAANEPDPASLARRERKKQVVSRLKPAKKRADKG